MKRGELVEIKNQQEHKPKEQILILPTDEILIRMPLNWLLKLTNRKRKWSWGGTRDVCLWTHSRLLPLVAKEKKCLRGRVTSLSFDATFMKRSC